MKTLFYPKLAWDGIRKNRRMVFPYILTCICMISMFYILGFLSSPKTIELFPRGRSTTEMLMGLGTFVIAIFSLIFLFYTNSFLIRRRAAEFGLYNVLGMGKGNLAKIITFESLITSGFSLIFGLILGIVLSKLAEIGLVSMLNGTVNYAVRVDADVLLRTAKVYLVIFGIIWISSVIRVGRSTAVSLLKSDKAGEKPPKANWFLGLMGVVILAAAYYVSAIMKNPIAALQIFFFAVIMVIIATYLLMIAGSVVLCKILQKNKRYYYKPAHFVSVSSMVYRMKRNGAGLASIAIISTMVLVIISSTTCLWFGSENMMEGMYPGDVNFKITMEEPEQLNEENITSLRNAIDEFDEEIGADKNVILDLYYVNLIGLAEGDLIDLTESDYDNIQSNEIRDVYLISIDSYNKQTGTGISLSDGEALLFTSECSFDHDNITLSCYDDSCSYKIVRADAEELFADNYMKDIIPEIILVVPDLTKVAETFSESVDSDGYGILTMRWSYCIDVSYAGGHEEYGDALRDRLYDTREDDFGWMYFDERDSMVSEYLSMNGSFLFLGIMLSIVFSLAAVLIIYYKQISEGYEDCKRFGVMRKVGMTKKDIKRSINSQLLVVFFIPLFFAGMHLLFAFPIISRMLTVFGLYNVNLLLITTLASLGVFALFYAAVYKITSNVYYNIVSDVQ